MALQELQIEPHGLQRSEFSFLPNIPVLVDLLI